MALTQDGAVGAALDPWAPACLLGSRVTQVALARPPGSHRTDADSEAAETLLPSGLCLQPPAFRGSLGPLCRGAREPTLDPEAPNLMEPRAPSRPLPSHLLKLRSRGNRGRSLALPRELISGLGSQASIPATSSALGPGRMRYREPLVHPWGWTEAQAVPQPEAVLASLSPGPFKRGWCFSLRRGTLPACVPLRKPRLCFTRQEWWRGRTEQKQQRRRSEGAEASARSEVEEATAQSEAAKVVAVRGSRNGGGQREQKRRRSEGAEAAAVRGRVKQAAVRGSRSRGAVGGWRSDGAVRGSRSDGAVRESRSGGGQREQKRRRSEGAEAAAVRGSRSGGGQREQKPRRGRRRQKRLPGQSEFLRRSRGGFRMMAVEKAVLCGKWRGLVPHQEPSRPLCSFAGPCFLALTFLWAFGLSRLRGGGCGVLAMAATASLPESYARV
ncbi:LOW QUALITY PROTEIN: EF-hand calcium-binding domain-containing protein 5 [Plecturocebus cupreus]